MQEKKFLLSCFILMGLGKQCLAHEEYFPEVGGWLRLHIVPSTWSDARLRCQLEGGTLASPTTNALTTALMKMMNASIMQDRSVFIGLQNSVFKRNSAYINGVPLSSVSLRWADGSPNSVDNAEDCLVMTDAGELADVSCGDLHPYFCYKAFTCGSANNGFALEPRTGSCYKFVPRARTWGFAQVNCVAEGARLAIINSDMESQVLRELFAKYPAASLQYATITNYVHIGFWYLTNTGWVTFNGQTFTDAGFATWDAGEPNNPTSEYCGSMTRGGLLNDISCTEKSAAYICEITPETFNNKYS